MNDIAIYNDDNGVQRIQLSPDMARNIRTLQQFQITLQEMKNAETEVKEQFATLMDELGIDKLVIDDIEITRKKGYTRTTIDSKLLKEKHPKIAKECSKTTNVAPSTVINYGY
jgi:predicted phage-related endonuclease